MSKKNFKIINLLEDYITLEDGKILHLTKHARDRLTFRNIPEDYVKQAFNKPDSIFPNEDFDNAKNYVKTIDNVRIKIGVKDDEEPFVLITAFIQ